ncbi:MAG: hypothetical protein ABIA93_03650 [Candidatus Woesearchaeota archaeon]
MKLVRIFCLGVLLLFVASCSRSSYVFAAVPGWVFDVNSSSGNQHYFVPFEPHTLPSAPDTPIEVMNERQLIELARTKNWTGPFERHTLEDWTATCDARRANLHDCSNNGWVSACNSADDKECKSFDYWSMKCQEYNSIQSECPGLPYDNYEATLQTYLEENGIEGKITSRYVGYFMIAGSGLNMTSES